MNVKLSKNYYENIQVKIYRQIWSWTVLCFCDQNMCHVLKTNTWKNLCMEWIYGLVTCWSNFEELLKQEILLNNFPLSKNEQDTSHKWYMWNGILAGYLFLVSISFLRLDTFGFHVLFNGLTEHWAFSKPWSGLQLRASFDVGNTAKCSLLNIDDGVQNEAIAQATVWKRPPVTLPLCDISPLTPTSHLTGSNFLPEAHRNCIDLGGFLWRCMQEKLHNWFWLLQTFFKDQGLLGVKSFCHKKCFWMRE